MKKYTHFTLEERENLHIMRNKGLTFAAIGKTLGRSGSSLSREYKRNEIAQKNLGYLPDTANKLAQERKASHGKKFDKYPRLKKLIIKKMSIERYSPEMIAGTLKLNKAKVTISTESIYQYIYSKEGQELKLYKYLMRARPKRSQKYGRQTRSDYGIPDRVSISQRPEISPKEFGHFEADLTFFKGSGKINALTMVERKTGYLMADLNQTKESQIIAMKLLGNLIKFPKKARKTITFDNGKEFVMHNKIREITGPLPIFVGHERHGKSLM